MATSAQFVATPAIGSNRITAGNANRDGSGALTTIIAGSAPGRKISSVKIKFEVSTTSGMIRFFIYDGTNNRIYTECVVEAVMVAADVASYEKEIFFDDLILPTVNHELRATCHNSEAVCITAMAGDF